MHLPHVQNIIAAKWILWYLKSTLQDGLFLSPTTLFTVTSYTDADWASCLDTG